MPSPHPFVRQPLLRAAALLALLILLVPRPQTLHAQSYSLQPLLSGLSRPTAIANAGDGSNRLFILEQTGRVLIYENGALRGSPFLDVSQQIACCGERGLLGIAFHPDYASNGEFFINYTNTVGDSVISRFTVSANPSLAEAGSEEILLVVQQPFSNHNGGHLAFGPDGFLYIGLGDGGGAGDPLNNAQDRLSLLGKMLRIDVDSGSPYAIPDDNPFAFTDATLDEIWALGLRNPFRYSFDRLNGDLYIADVGQDAIEEVHVQRAVSGGGANYGWRLMEGSQCFNPSTNCNDGTLTLPAFEYAHSAGRCSITGGTVYRGGMLAELQGDYLYGDFCTGELFKATEIAPGIWEQQVLLDSTLRISSFGESEAGEILLADIAGGIHLLTKPLDLSPGSGVYFQSQFIDLGLALRLPGVSISSLSLTVNGGDVTSQFNSCAIAGMLEAGGLTRRCPDLPLTLLAPGSYTIELSLLLSDGSQLSDSVSWTILANSE